MRFELTEESISKFKDRSTEFMKSEEERGKTNEKRAEP